MLDGQALAYDERLASEAGLLVHADDDIAAAALLVTLLLPNVVPSVEMDAEASGANTEKSDDRRDDLVGPHARIVVARPDSSSQAPRGDRAGSPLWTKA